MNLLYSIISLQKNYCIHKNCVAGTVTIMLLQYQDMYWYNMHNVLYLNSIFKFYSDCHLTILTEGKNLGSVIKKFLICDLCMFYLYNVLYCYYFLQKV